MSIITADLSFIFIVLEQRQAWNGSDVYHFQFLVSLSATFFHKFYLKPFWLELKTKCTPFMTNGHPYPNLAIWRTTCLSLAGEKFFRLIKVDVLAKT